MTTNEFNLSEKIEFLIKGSSAGKRFLWEEDVREFIRRLKKGCGKLFGGKNNSDWICGDFLEERTDEEGRSLGRCYYCKNCNELREKIDKLAGKKLVGE